MAGSKDNTIFIADRTGPALTAFLRAGNYSTCFIICDSNTLKHCLSPLVLGCALLKDAEVIELEPGEESKDPDVLISTWQTLNDFGADKKSLIINLGGGVVSDIGGFAASTYKRGIDFVNIPTTLLAMADASIGGKTGINLSGIKNLVGTITQPKAVFIDPAFLKTLPVRHLVNGFAEIIKAALIRDKKFFERISLHTVDATFNDLAIISGSVGIKSSIVKKDPGEKSLRKILNFGHTVGHAVESLFLDNESPLLHGEAIAIGMVIESYISYSLRRLTKTEFTKITHCLSLNFKFYPVPAQHLPAFFHYFDQDKKHLKRSYRLALLKGIGKCDPEVKVSRTQVEKAVLYYNTHLANAS